RILKWTYGVEIMEDFDIRNDPPNLREIKPKYISNGMRPLGTLKIALSQTPSSGRDRPIERPIEFGLTFGKMEIKAMARNKLT
ncbi:30210_t:CDS:2, partial [Racocetra persica]